MKTELELELGVRETVPMTRAAKWSSPAALASLPTQPAGTLSGPAQQRASHSSTDGPPYPLDIL